LGEFFEWFRTEGLHDLARNAPNRAEEAARRPNTAFAHVAALLGSYDVDSFDPYAPPPKTQWFHQMVSHDAGEESDDIAQCLESLGNPAVLTIEDLASQASSLGLQELRSFLQERKNGKVVAHKLSALGYAKVRNPDREDGRFVASRKRLLTIYALTTTGTGSGRVDAAREYTRSL
jgi:hypothetical protein